MFLRRLKLNYRPVLPPLLPLQPEAPGGRAKLPRPAARPRAPADPPAPRPAAGEDGRRRREEPRLFLQHAGRRPGGLPLQRALLLPRLKTCGRGPFFKRWFHTFLFGRQAVRFSHGCDSVNGLPSTPEGQLVLSATRGSVRSHRKEVQNVCLKDKYFKYEA